MSKKRTTNGYLDESRGSGGSSKDSRGRPQHAANYRLTTTKTQPTITPIGTHRQHERVRQTATHRSNVRLHNGRNGRQHSIHNHSIAQKTKHRRFAAHRCMLPGTLVAEAAIAS